MEENYYYLVSHSKRNDECECYSSVALLDNSVLDESILNMRERVPDILRESYDVLAAGMAHLLFGEIFSGYFAGINLDTPLMHYREHKGSSPRYLRFFDDAIDYVWTQLDADEQRVVSIVLSALAEYLLSSHSAFQKIVHSLTGETVQPDFSGAVGRLLMSNEHKHFQKPVFTQLRCLTKEGWG